MKIIKVNVDWMENIPNSPRFLLLVDHIDPEILATPSPFNVFVDQVVVAITDDPDDFPNYTRHVLLDPVWLAREVSPFGYSLYFTDFGWVPYHPEMHKSNMEPQDRDLVFALRLLNLEKLVWAMASADPDLAVREEMCGFAAALARQWTPERADAYASRAAEATYTKPTCRICGKELEAGVFDLVPILPDGPHHPRNRLLGDPGCCRAYENQEPWVLEKQRRVQRQARLYFSFDHNLTTRLKNWTES